MLNKGSDKKGSETILGVGTIVEGKVHTEESVRIEGALSGEVVTAAAVTVEKGAEVKGDIKAGRITVAGEVRGNITASDETNLTATARVFGDITTAVLSIAPGAVFAGTSAMSENEPAKHPTHETEVK